jgi:pSer/pThr/pTyr-binding forkhead associated (FHA) protein
MLHPRLQPSRRLLVPDQISVVVGRDPRVDVVLDEPRVSKRHALLERDDDRWCVTDLGSKNGTTVNGEPAARVRLRDGDWISFGGFVAQFAALSDRAVSRLDAEREWRRQTSAECAREVVAAGTRDELLRRFLAAALELTGTERGFVVTRTTEGRLQIEAAAPFGSGREPAAFEGSVGVVEQVLRTGNPVVLSNVREHGTLGARPSVVERRLSAIACVALRDARSGSRAIYLDGSKPGPGFTDLDLEILDGLADQVSLALASFELHSRIEAMFGAASRPTLLGIACD